ncbi:MAG: hypothetical protein V3V05_08585 [Pontiella sp.]
MATSSFAVENIIIRNAVLVDRSDAEADKVVNLLIKQGKLSLVTVGSAPEMDEAQVVDARMGFILGRLDIGQLATFMILDQDPSTNFDALLDTQTHGVFVIKDGEILRNRLIQVVAKEKNGNGLRTRRPRFPCRLRMTVRGNGTDSGRNM